MKTSQISSRRGAEAQRGTKDKKFLSLRFGVFARGILTLLFTLFFLLGCPPAKPSSIEAEAPQQEPFREPRFALCPPSASPGEPVTVCCSGSFVTRGNLRGLQAVLLNTEGKRLSRAEFFSLPVDALAGSLHEDGGPEIKAAVLAIPSTATPSDVTILIESDDGIIHLLPFTIENREFQSETIHLNQSNTELRTVPDPQKTAESEQLWAILSKTGTEIYSGDQFINPVSSNRRTSAYGDRRIYQYSSGSRDTSIHAGIDIGVPTGTEVRSCAKGRVVLARSRIVTGNTVVLEHLPGLYSLYYHMDKIAVSEGAIVEKGTPLGESGSTGLATGPHLHWEIRVASEYVDPDVFLSRPLIDKNEIIAKLGLRE